MRIMEKMFELCVNRYARVRITAQSRFCRMVDTVSSIITAVVSPMFIHKLQDAVPHDEYKVSVSIIIIQLYSRRDFL